MQNGKIWLSSPTMHGEEQEYIGRAFATNWVAPLGPNVTEFEEVTAKYLGAGYGAALVSGTAALHLAVKLAGVKKGDIVFCSDLTFAATVNPVTYEGGQQVFIDSERDTWNMDPKALELAFQKYPHAKAVIVADLYGTPAKLKELKEITESHGAIFIEDAAEGLGASYQGKKLGTFGKYNILSFNGNKIITTSGGGMLISDDEEAVKKARFWATQARESVPWYEHKEIGYNYRMSNIVAGIGLGQMKHLDEHVATKKKIYERYREGFKAKKLPVSMNPYLSDTEPNFWLSCFVINKGVQVSPLTICEALQKENIETRPIWKPMHLQPVYEKNDFIHVPNDTVGEDIFARGLCLPSDIKMTVEEQDMVIEKIAACFA